MKQFHNVEVDQSGKIERTKSHTVLAFTDTEFEHSILIPATVKRDVIRLFRQQGLRGNSGVIKFFTIGLYLLLKDDAERLRSIVIDVEYVGHSGAIKARLLDYLRRDYPNFDKERLIFRRIGKESAAHDLAIKVYKKKKKPSRTISIKEIKAVL